MPTRLHSVVIAAADPAALSRWWAEALCWQADRRGGDEWLVGPANGADLGFTFRLVFVPLPAPADALPARGRVHLDLHSDSPEDQAALVARLLDAGAVRADIGQGDVPWVVLTDPEGYPFCVLQPQQAYRHCGRLAAVVVTASSPATLGRFWAIATGRRMALSGPTYAALPPTDGIGPLLEFVHSPAVPGPNPRMHLDLSPAQGEDPADDATVLRGLGARPVPGDPRIPRTAADAGQRLVDPEGNPFCLLSPV